MAEIGKEIAGRSDVPADVKASVDGLAKDLGTVAPKFAAPAGGRGEAARFVEIIEGRVRNRPELLEVVCGVEPGLFDRLLTNDGVEKKPFFGRRPEGGAVLSPLG